MLAFLAGTEPHVDPGEEAHDQEDGERDACEADDFAEHEFEACRGLGDDGVDDPAFDFLGEIGAGEDDAGKHDDEAGGEDADFNGLADGILLVECSLKLSDGENADDGERGDPENAFADGFGKADARDGPDAGEAEAAGVVAADEEKAHDDDDEAGDPTPIVAEPGKAGEEGEYVCVLRQHRQMVR